MSHDEVLPGSDDQRSADTDGAVSKRRTDALAREQFKIQAEDREALLAQELIDDFIIQARAKGIEPEYLRAQLSGGGTARTDKMGWYIKINRTVAIGTDGGYYICAITGGLRDRLTGVRLTPTKPTLQVSRGARDGEGGDLADFLTKRLRDA